METRSSRLDRNTPSKRPRRDPNVAQGHFVKASELENSPNQQNDPESNQTRK